jgi:hypothetical protein
VLDSDGFALLTHVGGSPFEVSDFGLNVIDKLDGFSQEMEGGEVEPMAEV